jgi:DNA mismatch repair protein MSH3
VGALGSHTLLISLLDMACLAMYWSQAVQPAVGVMVYDQFQDSTSSLSELELRLSHLQPAEILYPRSSSSTLEASLINWKKYGGQSGVRTEKLPDEWFDYTSALSTVTEFYGGHQTLTTDSHTSGDSMDTQSSGQDEKDNNSCHLELEAQGLQKVISLPKCSLSCLSALIHHLKVFKLQQVLKLTSNLELFSAGDRCMKLNSKTLENLEIFQNMEEKNERNTLFWILNHTKTPFGRRLLRKWTANPLRRVAEVERRQAAVSQLSSSESPSVSLLKKLVSRLPDLEKMLCSAYHKKCSPLDFCDLMHHLTDISSQVEAVSETALADLQSELLHSIIKEIPRLLRGCSGFLQALNESSAREGCYEDLFANVENYPAVLKEKKCIAEVQERLGQHKQRFRRTLAYPKADYTTVSGVQYLVEVKNKDINKVPSDWTRISGTKQVTRFHPPYVLEDVQLLAQHSELLVANAKQAWNEFLSDFGMQYGACKKAVDLLATLDCLLSLAAVAVMPGYVCPRVVEGAVVEIEAGRHPVIDLLLTEGEQFVANDTKMRSSDMRAMIITGPNMGGKSSYIKQVALICIMAQIGSFVPAKSATLGMLDAVYTRYQMNLRELSVCIYFTWRVLCI